MEIFEEITGALYNAGKAISDKADQVAQMAKLKSEIMTCDDVLKKNFIAIGKKYYEAHKDDAGSELAKELTAITNAMKGKADLEEKLRQLKRSNAEPTAEATEITPEAEAEEAPAEAE
ncbi:MAG: hypothetical protein K5891_10220 [Lachnospiraceae bacterium]|nr:hypothetical protein [Lachnospiraceae bacterium]